MPTTAAVRRGKSARPSAAPRETPGAPIAVLVVGPLPPPYHGGAVATQYVLRSTLASVFRLIHLDTTDRRGVSNIGRLDGRNVFLALRHFADFIRLLRREMPDLVYVPVAQNRLGFLRDCLFLLPALLAGRRIVVHVHGGGFGELRKHSDPVTRGLLRFTMMRVHQAIVLGETLRGTLAGLVHDARVAVVPNGISDPYAQSPACRSSSAACTILYLGTLMEAKGFLDVIAAAHLLAERGVDARFVIAGEFFRARDERDAGALLAVGSARVELTGPVDAERRTALMREADVFVFPTRYANEAHPYVVLEAMAAGLPVITTARGAIAETVLDGETGVLVPEAEVEALADALEAFVREPDLRRRMGDAARRRFLEEYGVERWATRVEGVWRNALANS